jgi:outer membrane protein assembly factor BamC
MLRRLMVRLGVQEARAKAGIEQASVTTPRAKISRAQDGSGRLAIDDQFDRAWRRVGLALDRVGFTVEDRDRSKGLYYVRYVDPQADAKSKEPSGLLSKLAFWRSKEEVAASGSEYRIRVQGEGDVSTISVMTREGGEDTSSTARKILGLLQQQLR